MAAKMSSGNRGHHGARGNNLERRRPTTGHISLCRCRRPVPLDGGRSSVDERRLRRRGKSASLARAATDAIIRLTATLRCIRTRGINVVTSERRRRRHGHAVSVHASLYGRPVTGTRMCIRRQSCQPQDMPSR